MSERGQYGKNGGNGAYLHAWVGQGHPSTIYVEHAPASTAAWVIGALAAGGAVLWARHQALQIERIYKTAGMPYQSFASSLGQRARSIPSRVRGIVGGKAPSSVLAPPEADLVDYPTHSTRSRSRAW